MTPSTHARHLCRRFAEVLDYPTSGLAAAVAACLELLEGHCPDAVGDMQAFAAFAEGESLGRLEEIYTRTFDITPTTTLYVGYHLFGESYKRGAFLAKLQEAYLKHGFSPGTELADHLCVLLRFAGTVDDPEFVNPLLEEAIPPALGKVDEAFKESKSGYALAVSALRRVVGEGEEAKGGKGTRDRESGIGNVESDLRHSCVHPFSPLTLLPFSPSRPDACPVTLDPIPGGLHHD